MLRNSAVMLRALSLLLTFALAPALHAGNASPDKELAAFLGEVEMQNVSWTKYDGTDFTLFYCTAQPPRTGAAGVYLSREPIAA